MIPRTIRNYRKLQTLCSTCGHPEWDHYMHALGSDTACDSGGCKCLKFIPRREPMKIDEGVEYAVEVPGRGYIDWAGNLVEQDVMHCLPNINDAVRMMDDVKGRYRNMGCPEVAQTVRVVQRTVTVTRGDWAATPVNGEPPA